MSLLIAILLCQPALREKRDGADEVSGQLQDILKELLMLGKKQSRCGLDKPDEETAARIRDLVQAVVEKAPKIASQNIDKLRLAVNGKWSLMFTNSEMFDFYNGVTGFANVFPAAKFDSLKVNQQTTAGGFSYTALKLPLTTLTTSSSQCTPLSHNFSSVNPCLFFFRI